MSQKYESFALEEIILKQNSKVSILPKLSHELKTPIHGIKGIASFLRDNWSALEEKNKLKYIDVIIEAGDNLSLILSSMLDNLDNKEEINFKFIEKDLIAIIKSTVDKCKNLYSNRSEFNIVFESTIARCLATVDEFWINQLIINLISNAINYNKEGKIEVFIKLETIKDIDHCVILVKDEGKGVDQKDLAGIFDPFNRGSQDNSDVNGSAGTGLGLAICREIVEAHGGKISADNTEAGFIVAFTVPIK